MEKLGQCEANSPILSSSPHLHFPLSVANRLAHMRASCAPMEAANACGGSPPHQQRQLQTVCQTPHMTCVCRVRIPLIISSLTQVSVNRRGWVNPRGQSSAQLIVPVPVLIVRKVFGVCSGRGGFEGAFEGARFALRFWVLREHFLSVFLHRIITHVMKILIWVLDIEDFQF
jgi:hypothetical protein